MNLYSRRLAISCAASSSAAWSLTLRTAVYQPRKKKFTICLVNQSFKVHSAVLLMAWFLRHVPYSARFPSCLNSTSNIFLIVTAHSLERASETHPSQQPSADGIARQFLQKRRRPMSLTRWALISCHCSLMAPVRSRELKFSLGINLVN